MDLVHTATDQQLLSLLEDKVSDLASLWRGQKNTPEADQIVQTYWAVLRCMIALGFHQPLDLDSELPDRLLPQEYLDILHSS